MANKPLDSKIVLVGKTGTGKSASGNTILGNKSFTEDRSSSPVTKKCSTMTRELNGQKLTVVDTPGLLDTSEDQLETMTEIAGFIDLLFETLPGPHVFLWVVKLGSFTRQDRKWMDIYKKLFPSASRFTIVLFTHGHGGIVESFIDNYPTLKEFIRWCNDRYHVFDNDLKGDVGQGQVEDLVKMINKIEQNYKMYKLDLIQQAYEVREEPKNQPVEETAGGCKKETRFLVQVVEKSETFDTDQCLPLKTFLKGLRGLAEKITKNERTP